MEFLKGIDPIGVIGLVILVFSGIFLSIIKSAGSLIQSLIGNLNASLKDLVGELSQIKDTLNKTITELSAHTIKTDSTLGAHSDDIKELKQQQKEFDELLRGIHGKNKAKN